MNEKIIERIAEFESYLYGIRSLKISTAQMYGKYLHKMFRRINKKPEEITQDDLEVYISKIRKEKRPNSVRVEQNAVRLFFDWYSEKYDSMNPTKNMRKIPIEITSPVIFNKEEFVKMVDACGYKSFRDLRNAAMFCLMADTGVRVSELVNIKVGHVREDKNRFILLVLGDDTTKSYMQRQIPFCNMQEKSIVAEYFSAYWQTIKYIKKWDSEEYLFQPISLRDKEEKHARMHRNLVRHAILTAAKKAGIKKKVSPHSFRHFYATFALLNDMKIQVLKERLGHRDVSATFRYVHMADLMSDDSLKNNPLADIRVPNGKYSGFVANLKTIWRKQK